MASNGAASGGPALHATLMEAEVACAVAHLKKARAHAAAAGQSLDHTALDFLDAHEGTAPPGAKEEQEEGRAGPDAAQKALRLPALHGGDAATLDVKGKAMSQLAKMWRRWSPPRSPGTTRRARPGEGQGRRRALEGMSPDSGCPLPALAVARSVAAAAASDDTKPRPKKRAKSEDGSEKKKKKKRRSARRPPTRTPTRSSGSSAPPRRAPRVRPWQSLGQDPNRPRAALESGAPSSRRARGHEPRGRDRRAAPGRRRSETRSPSKRTVSENAGGSVKAR